MVSMTRGPVRAVLTAVLCASALPTQAHAQVTPSPLIAPVVYHWSQVQNAYPTLEGGSVAGASERFWGRQIRLLERAGLTAQLFQVVAEAQTSQRNHLRALRTRRGEGGPLPPFVVPFYAAESFPEYETPKDVLSAAGFDAFYQLIRGFFLMYAESFPAPAGGPGVLDPELLATVDGRVFIVLWWVPLTDYDLPADFFSRLSDRLEEEFGFRAYWSTHRAWLDGNPDDINYLFNGNEPIRYGHNPRYPAVDLQVALWPPNLDSYRIELYAPRNGGETYAAAWDGVVASHPRPVIVLIESYNEITEGSHMMPSWPVDHVPGDGHWTGPPDDPICLTQPCHPVEFVESWGSDNPWHFLDLTHARIRGWLEGPLQVGVDHEPPHVFIITPKTDEGGSGLLPVEIVAADDRALREVRVFVDGRLALVTAGSVEKRLKSQLLAPGRHVLYVEAEDTAGQIDTDRSHFVVTRTEERPPGLSPGPVLDAAELALLIVVAGG